MELGRDLLDSQLIDRDFCPIGKVDGIVLELRPGSPPRVAYLEVGGITPARRLPRPLRGIAMAIARRWGLARGAPFRIPWTCVRRVQREVHVSLAPGESSADAWEQRLRDGVVSRLPGA